MKEDNFGMIECTIFFTKRTSKVNQYTEINFYFIFLFAYAKEIEIFLIIFVWHMKVTKTKAK